ncbi:MAG: 5-(carboxyamino)imidazole ribonucleotide mutase [Planctomycetota bacterium]|jgi:5-(carboxyamino)imidazole ribonucleotide mutase|nr:5-(carboxyamino)imidazole ribonucleotide mutase [Planctomycetota bacterium]MDP6521013.1 5-(carboxyamino)imidazole ribonucleotide mutase [Planctomycetota bacterium]
MKVAFLMGSDSDLPRLEQGLALLGELEIPFEARVLSAHRTPGPLLEYMAQAEERGAQVFICAAGGAAHLAGVVAAHTDKPVLGIPMDNPPLGGLDALLATVQMPGGVPVATFGVGSGGPANAALFAARLLALSDAGLAERLAAWRLTQAEKVAAKDERLQAQLGS